MYESEKSVFMGNIFIDNYEIAWWSAYLRFYKLLGRMGIWVKTINIQMSRKINWINLQLFNSFLNVITWKIRMTISPNKFHGTLEQDKSSTGKELIKNLTRVVFSIFRRTAWAADRSKKCTAVWAFYGTECENLVK